MSFEDELNVHIGEIKLGSPGQTLKTILGSCVGIGLLWRKKKLYGLAHCLLPEIIPSAQAVSQARFVEIAIPNLLKMMEVPLNRYDEIEAVVVGGGNMTHERNCNPILLVGLANSNLAKSMLSKLQIKIVHEDIGGEEGRKLSIDCSTGSYIVEIIPRLIAG